MAELIISCLSQKGGVGKSTLARLIARTYATAGWGVKICDFNTTQLTSVKWGRLRSLDTTLPRIIVEPCHQPSTLRRAAADLVVADGRPDSDQTSLDIARISDLIIVPTGLSLDDLEPQLLFADELVAKGVNPNRILFILNKTTDSPIAVTEARSYLNRYPVADRDITQKISYQRAQNHGRALSEVGGHIGRLEEHADVLAAEIVTRITKIQELIA
jgi:chromosome partitioning protein